MPTIDEEYLAQPFARAVGEPVIAAPHREGENGTVQSSIIIPEQAHTIETLKVSARSRPSAVAGAIAGVMREYGEVDVQAIGAGAINQAVKAIAIARSYLQNDGIDVCCVPSFIDVLIDGNERTAIRLFVQQFTPQQSQSIPILDTSNGHNKSH